MLWSRVLEVAGGIALLRARGRHGCEAESDSTRLRRAEPREVRRGGPGGGPRTLRAVRSGREPRVASDAIKILGSLILLVGGCEGLAKEVHHYVFFNRDREKISSPVFLTNQAFAGAQLKYTWGELEPAKDEFDFSSIRQDLTFLRSRGKKLFVQIQDVSFDPGITNVPRYLLLDPRYHGGADKQYSIPDDDEARAVVEGWVARRWDPAVQERFHQLLDALGREFDGRIEGVNLAETAVSFGESGRLFPAGFTPTVYREAVVANMTALKRAFPRSVAMQYANFMPGEWLPGQDAGHLRAVYRRARELKIGVGAPDLLPYQPGQMNHCYPLLRECAGIVPTGIAVQEGNYAHTNPKTGRRVTVADLLAFATGYLRVDYIFWCDQEPFYSRDLVPVIRREVSRIRLD